MSSVKKLAIRGTIWTIASYGSSQILRFGSNLILTRLLVPEVFGLMALVYVFIIGINLFSDLGIGPSLIQNKRGDEPDFYNTAWTMQVFRSIGIWFCCLLIAWPASILYGEPQLFFLIPAVGFNSVLDGFKSTSEVMLNRRLEIGKLSFYEFVGQIISIVVMIILAAIYRNVWSLVIGSLVSALILTVWSHWWVPGVRNRFFWETEAAKSIFSFGKWIFISTALTFVSEQSDRLILGRLITLTSLGVYGIAFALSDIPRQVLTALSGKVLFPAFSKFADLPRPEFRAKIQKNRKIFLLGATLGVAVLASIGDKLIPLLYPKAYDDAAWMLPLLAIGFWPRILTQTIDAALFAVGQSRYPALGSFLKFLYMSIGLPLGFHLMGGSQGYGLQGALIVIALNDIPYYGAVLYGLWRERLACVMQDLKATALFFTLLAVFIGIRSALGFGFPLEKMFLP